MADDDQDTPDQDEPAPDEPDQGTPDEPDDDFDRERAMATIRKQREEAKTLRAEAKKAADLQKRLDDIEAEQLTEQEKAEKRAHDAEQKAAAAEDRLRRGNLLAELAKPDRGIVNAKAAAKLLEGVEYDEDGEPVNLDDILPVFLEENPFLKTTGGKPAAPDIDGGRGRKADPAAKLTAAEAEMAEKLGMTPDEYASYRDVESVGDYQALKAKTT